MIEFRCYCGAPQEAPRWPLQFACTNCGRVWGRTILNRNFRLIDSTVTKPGSVVPDIEAQST